MDKTKVELKVDTSFIPRYAVLIKDTDIPIAWFASAAYCIDFVTRENDINQSNGLNIRYAWKKLERE